MFFSFSRLFEFILFNLFCLEDLGHLGGHWAHGT